MIVKFLTEDSGIVFGLVDGAITGVDQLQTDGLLGEVESHSNFEKDVVLDISGADTIDSSGVSWLIRCHKRFSQHDGKIVFHSLQPMVKNVLKMMSLDRILHIAANRDAALLLARGESA